MTSTAITIANRAAIMEGADYSVDSVSVYPSGIPEVAGSPAVVLDVRAGLATGRAHRSSRASRRIAVPLTADEARNVARAILRALGELRD